MKSKTLTILVCILLISQSVSQGFADFLNQQTQGTTTPRPSTGSSSQSCPNGSRYNIRTRRCQPICQQNQQYTPQGCVPRGNPNSGAYSDVPSSVQTPQCTTNCGQSRQVQSQEQLRKAFNQQNSPSNERASANFIIQSNVAALTTVDFSQTNNQVPTVDQADIIKTDGTYIYTLSNNIVSIIRAYPANLLSVVSTIDIEARGYTAKNLFIQNNYLVVIGQDIQYSVQVTKFGVYAINNRFCPYLITEQFIQGEYLEARKTSAGFFYLLSKHQISYRVNPTPYKSFGTQNMALSDIFYYSGIYQQPVFVNILTFSLATQTIAARAIITENAQIIYMSESNIYFSFNSNQANTDVTILHKIFVWGTYIVPFADKTLPGTIRNQFYMDQRGNILRIATTHNANSAIRNNLYCLDFYLNTIGSAVNFASSYEISAVRFIGNRAYLVMFGDVSPYFIVSLQNHYNPYLLGSFFISGFTSYIHPYNENYIMAIGKENNNFGIPGLKISIINVANPSSPIVSASYVYPISTSTSLSLIEHKAFLYNKAQNYIVVPITVQFNGMDYLGALPLKVFPNQIYPGTFIQHYENVERSVYIGNSLYTKSLCLLQVHDTNALDFQGSIQVPCQYSQLVYNNC